MEPLQGRVEVSFDAIAAKPEYLSAPPHVQLDVANRYFDDNYASKPEYQQAPKADQENARQRFLQDYNITKPTAPTAPNPLQGIGNIAKGIGNFAYNLPGQVANAVGTEIGSRAQDYQQGLTNPLQSLNPGNLQNYAPLMALEGVRNFAQMPADLLAAGQNAFQGNANAKPIYNLPSFGDLPFVGQGLKQAQERYPVSDFVAQGAIPVERVGGFVGALLKKTKKATAPAKLRGVVKASGAAYGDFGRPVGVRAGEKFNPSLGPVKNTSQFVSDAKKFQSIDAKTTASLRTQALKKRFDVLEAQHNATNNPAMQARIRKAQGMLQKHFKDEKAAVAPVGKTKLNPSSDTFKAVAKFGKELRDEGKTREANVALSQYDPETKAKLFDEIHRAEKAEKAHSAATKKQYEADYKKLLAEEKEGQRQQRALQAQAEKTQNLKDKEALQSQKASLKAESKTRQGEMKRLKGDITQRTKAEELEKSLRQKQTRNDLSALEKAEMENQARELRRLKGDIRSRSAEVKATEKPSKPQTQAAKLKEIRAAIDKKHGLELEYEAEKTGETGTYRNKTVSPYQVEINKSGVVQVRAINDEGQIRTYLVGDESGSKIVSAKSTGKAAAHEIGAHPETGKQIALARTGEAVEQVKKTGVKSSEIRANLSNMEAILERVKKGEPVSTEEIMKAAKPMFEKEFTDIIKDNDQVKIDDIGKKAGC